MIFTKFQREKKFAAMFFQVLIPHKTLETWSDPWTLMPNFIGLSGTVCALMDRDPKTNQKQFYPGIQLKFFRRRGQGPQT